MLMESDIHSYNEELKKEKERQREAEKALDVLERIYSMVPPKPEQVERIIRGYIADKTKELTLFYRAAEITGTSVSMPYSKPESAFVRSWQIVQMMHDPVIWSVVNMAPIPPEIYMRKIKGQTIEPLKATGYEWSEKDDNYKIQQGLKIAAGQLPTTPSDTVDVYANYENFYELLRQAFNQRRLGRKHAEMAKRIGIEIDEFECF